eukprot:3894686-Alexandrium_andersonii.AAC.1
MPTARKHEAHPLQEPRLRSVWMIDVEGKTIVVLEVGFEGSTVLELLVKDLTDGVCGDSRRKAG